MSDERPQKTNPRHMTLDELSRWLNRPAIVFAAFAVAIALGATRSPALQHLQPIGDFYVALLQMCVLPFLLATIPLAVRSAMRSGAAANVMCTLGLCAVLSVLAVSLVGILVASTIFHVLPIDAATLERIGTLIGESADRVDIEFALDPARTAAAPVMADAGLLAVIPSNVFAALATNDSMRVLVFAAIFGIGMVLSEKRSGLSVFGALQHIQEVCVLIFDWFSIFVPFGIIVLIAPQVARLGSQAFAVLALFAYAFFAASAVIVVGSIVVLSLSLHVPFAKVGASLLRPMMLGAATRNTLVCIPSALEAMTRDLNVRREPSELYVPIGFATIRFGNIMYFAITAMFVGMLLGRAFSVTDIALVAVLAVAASFGTLGLSGPAALGPLALVLRPFGLSYELAVPLLIILDPITNMIRVMLNVIANCVVPALAMRKPRA